MASADTFPLNDAARRLGPIHATYERTGVGQGPVTITMADGEILKGHYHVAFGSDEAFGFADGQAASAVAITGGPVEFVATGPKTEILCRGSSSTMGHGQGECQNEDGAVWAIGW